MERQRRSASLRKQHPAHRRYSRKSKASAMSSKLSFLSPFVADALPSRAVSVFLRVSVENNLNLWLISSPSLAALGLGLSSENVHSHAECPCLPLSGQILSVIHAKCVDNVLDPVIQTLGWKRESFSSQNASPTYDSPPQSESLMSQQIFHTYLSCEVV